MNIVRNISVNKRLSAIENELSEHTRALVSLDMYLLLIESALLAAKVFTKEDLDQLRTNVLSTNKKEESKIIKV